MCEDSRSERQYWVRRVEQLRQQMEREDLERRHVHAVAPAGPRTEQSQPRPGWVAGAARAVKAWITGTWARPARPSW